MQRFVYHFFGSVTLTSGLSPKIIVSRAYTLCTGLRSTVGNVSG